MPGWYPDPDGESRLRYFDGSSWTTKYAPMPATSAGPPPPTTAPFENVSSTWSQRPKWLVPALIVGGVVALIAIGNSGKDSDNNKPTSSTVTNTVTVTAQPTTVTQTVTLAAPPAPILEPPASEPEPPIADPAITEPPIATQPQPFMPVVPQAPASAYYGSCAEARAAGAAPLHVGEPGYRSGLDRDDDGVACE
jgi:hypothetical protein